MKICLNSVIILDDDKPAHPSILRSKVIQEIMSLPSHPEKEVNLYCSQLTRENVIEIIDGGISILDEEDGVEPNSQIIRNLLIFYDFLDNLQSFNITVGYYSRYCIFAPEIFYFIEWKKAFDGLNLPPISFALNLEKYSYAELFLEYVLDNLYYKKDGNFGLLSLNHDTTSMCGYLRYNTGAKKLFLNDENLEYIKSTHNDNIMICFLYFSWMDLTSPIYLTLPYRLITRLTFAITSIT